MTMRRLAPPTLLLTVVLAMGTRTAKAQETVRVAIPSGISVSAASDFFAVTGVTNGTTAITTECMQNSLGASGNLPVVKIVVVDTNTPPAATLIDTALLQSSLAPGTRLTELMAIGNCTDGDATYNIFEGVVSAPQNYEFTLAITPAGVTLTEGHEAVVSFGSNETGIADAVCVKQGERSFPTELLSDIPLEAGDRLTEFVQVDVDPETGETMYACRLEY